MSRNIEDLRDHLFAALDGLSDQKKPMEIDRARAIADVARVIVDSAKAEIQLLHAIGARHAATPFIPAALLPTATGTPAKSAVTEIGSRVRCPSCQQVTGTDPCGHCGKKVRK